MKFTKVIKAEEDFLNYNEYNKQLKVKSNEAIKKVNSQILLINKKLAELKNENKKLKKFILKINNYFDDEYFAQAGENPDDEAYNYELDSSIEEIHYELIEQSDMFKNYCKNMVSIISDLYFDAVEELNNSNREE